jgi:hypothetical protein
VIEQQCLDCVWYAAALALDDFLKCALNESERIARTRVQTNNVDVDMRGLRISGQATKQRSVSMLARSLTTKENAPPRGNATAVSPHPMSGMPP